MTVTEFPKTPQALFNIAATHMLTKKTRCARPGPFGSQACLYRLEGNEYNDRCAVGACIPDSLYTPAMEGESARNLIWVHRDRLGLGDLSYEDLDKLGRVGNAVQQVHDEIRPEFWEDELRQVAERLGLVMPEAA